jgi:hypothetical protein
MTASMLRDLLQGHRLELPWLSGDVSRRGACGGGHAVQQRGGRHPGPARPARMNTWPLRLTPGCDLRTALAEAVRLQLPTGSAFVLGHWQPGRRPLAPGRGRGRDLPGRPGGAADPGRHRLSAGPHLHATVADAQGRVLGGHLLPGNVVRTTAELLLAWSPEWALGRAPDVQTGFTELQIQDRR